MSIRSLIPPVPLVEEISVPRICIRIVIPPVLLAEDIVVPRIHLVISDSQ